MGKDCQGQSTTPIKIRTHSGSGGVIIIVGPKWGPSVVDGRSDDTGCGILAEVQLRTVTGKMHVMGSHWPEKSDDK